MLLVFFVLMWVLLKQILLFIEAVEDKVVIEADLEGDGTNVPFQNNTSVIY